MRTPRSTCSLRSSNWPFLVSDAQLRVGGGWGPKVVMSQSPPGCSLSTELGFVSWYVIFSQIFPSPFLEEVCDPPSVLEMAVLVSLLLSHPGGAGWATPGLQHGDVSAISAGEWREFPTFPPISEDFTCAVITWDACWPELSTIVYTPPPRVISRLVTSLQVSTTCRALT